MDSFQILGYVAAFLTTAANLPQAIKIIKTKSAKDISAITYSTLLAGLICWVIYGISEDDMPIILSNSISSLITGFVLLLKLLPQKKMEEVSDSILKKK